MPSVPEVSCSDERMLLLPQDGALQDWMLLDLEEWAARNVRHSRSHLRSPFTCCSALRWESATKHGSSYSR
jgi:hypothetical protein